MEMMMLFLPQRTRVISYKSVSSQILFFLLLMSLLQLKMKRVLKFTVINRLVLTCSNLSVLALKDYFLEVLPHAPQYDQVCTFLYNNRIKEEDDINLMEAGFLFDDLLMNFQISEEELKNVFLKEENIIYLTFFRCYKK